MIFSAWMNCSEPEPGPSYQALAGQFKEIPEMDISFANALAALVHNRFAPLADGEDKERRDADREVLMHWFEGGKVTKRELKPFQIYEFLNKGNARQFMNSLILFLRHTGHQGLILLLDEMETVVTIAKFCSSATAGPPVTGSPGSWAGPGPGAGEYFLEGPAKIPDGGGDRGFSV